MARICVIGMGYIGLPTAAILATSGHQVLGVDIDEQVLQDISEARGLDEEPGLAVLVGEALSSKRLALSTTPAEADVFILCLPTPVVKEHTADLSFVEKGAEAILPLLQRGNMVILESTVPPGTTKELVAPILERGGLKAGTDFHVAFAPERVIPGNIVHEIVHIDRIIGGLSPACTKIAGEIYSSFAKGEMVLTDATTAEFVKLIENTFRDVNIALANELALVAEKRGINVWDAIAMANHHPRVNLHRPGPGVGGHCIAVDPYFIIQAAREETRLLATAREVNDSMPAHVVSLAKKMLGGLEGRKLAVLGVAYKGDVGDPRESPSFEVIRLLREEGAVCSIHDPHVKKAEIGLVSLERALEGAELVIVLTDHSAYKELEPETVGRHVAEKRMLDTRNVLDRRRWEEKGWAVGVLGDGR